LTVVYLMSAHKYQTQDFKENKAFLILHV